MVEIGTIEGIEMGKLLLLAAAGISSYILLELVASEAHKPPRPPIESQQSVPIPSQAGLKF